MGAKGELTLETFPRQGGFEVVVQAKLPSGEVVELFRDTLATEPDATAAGIEVAEEFRVWLELHGGRMRRKNLIGGKDHADPS
jgi:hypothetical protein